MEIIASHSVRLAIHFIDLQKIRITSLIQWMAYKTDYPEVRRNV